MAPRRRDRRFAAAAAADPDRQVRSDHQIRGPSTGPSKYASIILLLLLLVVASIAVYRFAYTSPPAAPPAVTTSVYERGLVKPDTNYQDIIRESGKVSANKTRRHFPNKVLAYITPWNSKGYDMAKLFSSKFTHLSPVWYNLKSEGMKLVLDGRHNADMGWISELRSKGPALILPRVVLEAFSTDMLQQKKQRKTIIDIIINECKDMGYDGIVLESWSRWAAYGVLHDPELRAMALQFIKELGNALHSISSIRSTSHHLELIYVIPAIRSQSPSVYDFGPQDFQLLSDSVDGFSLMTYDFSGPQNPGPSAPLAWVRSSLQFLLGTEGDTLTRAHMIFLGINFYGNDFDLSGGSGGGAITGRDYILLLEKHKPVLRWEEKSREHVFIYTVSNAHHAVFYPSLMSISERLEEAKSWGAGMSVWEIGQGLDYFFDLL